MMRLIVAAVVALLFADPAHAVIKVLTPVCRDTKEATTILVAAVGKVDPEKSGVTIDDGPKKESAARGATGSSLFATIPFHFEPIFGVIPSSVLLGPLAILAAVFPSTFGSVTSGMKRWRVLLVVVSTNSVLATVYFFISKPQYKILPDPVPWWSSEAMLVSVLLGVTLIGMVVAGRRYRVAVWEDPDVTEAPTRKEFLGLAGAAATLGLMLIGIGWWFGWNQLWLNPGREFTATFLGLIAAALYSAYRHLGQRLDAEAPAPRMSAPGEAVALATIFVFGVVMLTRAALPVDVGSAPSQPEAVTGAPSITAPRLQDFELIYETREMDRAMSGVTVTEQFLYIGGLRQTPLSLDGVLVCLDRATGKQVWVFDSSLVPREWKTTNPNGLRTVYSTPAVANGKLYFGEGLHTDSDCRLYCLEAATGKPLWRIETKSHTEGGPVVEKGKVYFSAGDDGLFCADADSGKVLWQYPAGRHTLHIDTPVTVVDGRVFGGSGYNTWAAFALDAETGQEIWKKEIALRSFGTPLVSGTDVFFGLGTGNLTEDLSTEKEPGKPRETQAAGVLLCLDRKTGAERWQAPLPASVHTNLAADARQLYAACRDGWLYAVDRTSGKTRWRSSSGSPILAGPVIATDPSGRFPLAVYLTGPSGQVTCHDPITGGAHWGRGIPELVGRRTEVQSHPTLQWVGATKRELFQPVTLTNKNNAETKGGVVRFVDEDELFPLFLKNRERFEQAGYR